MFSSKFSRSMFMIAAVLAANTAFAVPSKVAFVSAIENLQYTLITLNAGTNITVTLNQQVDMNDVAVGNALDFSVRSDVSVAGRVVIAAGASATGIVTKVGKTAKGMSMTITVESALAVDGQTVNLNSVPHVINADQDGNVIGNIGTGLSARVRNTIKINA